MMMSVDALALPVTPELAPLPDAPSWLRRALLLTLIAAGVLLTLWIVAKAGPVAYGLPVAGFRRRPAA
jgi:hypothetical protein